MEIVLTAIDKGGDHTIHHDLNFRDERYETIHPVVRVPLGLEPWLGSWLIESYHFY